ncbi:galactose mutarotase [Rathayibacter sp. VKM Ac-2760]|uniref:aldose epimerase family protein n=1 Tax=Rathayibacter sp. VKM Ac-2760 TaxID=2609253 RepID=UPI00131736AB|nr:galactose mutarotase [Rathayibacter sp. VKM Ac-2760]QHC59601.1 galactose mutarotase [Rathayibacter sp. VKM Ac-2760]
MTRIVLATADGSVRASIDPVAASIRTLEVRGRALVEPSDGEQPPGAAGAVLVPWPNRVRDGRWLLDGAPQQLAITDPATHSANHGLLATTRYRVGARTADSVTLHARVDSAPGYPFALATSVRYALHPDGIDAHHVLVNESDRSAPVALGVHPYLRAGDAAEPRIRLPARERLVLDERHLPTGERHPVDGTPFDLRAGVLERDAPWHASLTALDREPDGTVRADLSAPGHGRTVLWADASFTVFQLYIDRDRQPPAIAIEPMTAPPDALNSGEGLRWLAPGERSEHRWGIVAE